MIDKYLISTCLFAIEDLNVTYRYVKTKEELRKVANEDLNEAGLVARLVHPFIHIAKLDASSTDGLKTHDIVVNSKNFIIEVKYLKQYKAYCKTFSNKTPWDGAFEKDYTWLCNEIQCNNKGKRAFVLGWFNCYDNFNEVMQLGSGSGQSPDINDSRLRLFPFLNRKPESNKTKDVFYMYSNAYKPIPIQIIGYDKHTVDCIFLGTPEDKFHFAIYY